MNYYPCLFEQVAEAIRFTTPLRLGGAGHTRVASLIKIYNESS